MSEPRPHTPEEVRDMLLQEIACLATYWANLPDVDKATNQRLSVLDRCEGVAFSILCALDGCSSLPGFVLKVMPHPEDEDYHRSQGENWFEAEMEIDFALHEYFRRQPPLTQKPPE